VSGGTGEDREEEPRGSLKKESSGERARERVMAAALKALAARPRSEQQLRERLLQKVWATPALVDECIVRLKELGYINDEMFAQSYARSRLGLRAVGRSRVARELQGKKVSRQTINAALDDVFEEVSEEALIERAMRKRIRTHGRPEDRADAKRMFDHLARLGFKYDLIIRKLGELKADVSEE
jgi:regulatory protein